MENARMGQPPDWGSPWMGAAPGLGQPLDWGSPQIGAAPRLGAAPILGAAPNLGAAPRMGAAPRRRKCYQVLLDFLHIKRKGKKGRKCKK